MLALKGVLDLHWTCYLDHTTDFDAGHGILAIIYTHGE